MKRIKALLTASALTFTAAFSSGMQMPHTVSAAESVNIMPIGDSITFGYGEDGGYRKYLDYALRAKDIAFDMVGPEGRNSESFNYNGQVCQYDGNHAGYSGFTIKQQYPIPSWGENGLLERLQSKNAVSQAQPDIVLLIIGTNDMTANRNLNDCEQDLHTLVDYILGDMPEDGVVFMGSIPEFTAYGGNAQRVGNYNNTVKNVAESYGDRVRFADVHGCLNGMADMSDDDLHPSGAGYEKMGKFWAEVIEEYLAEREDPDAPENPEILHSDFENGILGWQGRGAASVAQSQDEAAVGTASAQVTGRTAAWNGIAYSLSSRKCPAGTHISVQVSVKQKTGNLVRFKLTMQYAGGDSAVYDTFAEFDAPSDEWTTITAADYVVQEGASPVLYVETDTDLCDFYLDEVVILKIDPSALPVTVQGDVNMDGSLDLADAVLLEKWLMAVSDTQLADWMTGDMDQNGRLDAADLSLMKRALMREN